MPSSLPNPFDTVYFYSISPLSRSAVQKEQFVLVLIPPTLFTLSSTPYKLSTRLLGYLDFMLDIFPPYIFKCFLSKLLSIFCLTSAWMTSTYFKQESLKNRAENCSLLVVSLLSSREQQKEKRRCPRPLHTVPRNRYWSSEKNIIQKGYKPPQYPLDCWQ